MRGDGVLAEPLAEVPRDALGHPPRVDEDERRACARDQLREAVVVLLPDLVRHHRVERRARESRSRGPSRGDALRRRSRSAARSVPIAATRKRGDLLDRLLRRGSIASTRRSASASAPAPSAVSARRSLQPLERQREVRAAARADHGVDLVDDHGAHGAQHLAAALPRSAAGRATRASSPGCAAASAASPRARTTCVSPVRTAAVIRGAGSPGCFRELANAAPRLGEVLVDVGAQRLERRDVDDAHFIGQRPGRALRGRDRRCAVRNAASVLPEPVGAAISVWRPSRIAAQPRTCAAVGAPSVCRTSVRRAGGMLGTWWVATANVQLPRNAAP